MLKPQTEVSVAVSNNVSLFLYDDYGRMWLYLCRNEYNIFLMYSRWKERCHYNCAAQLLRLRLRFTYALRSFFNTTVTILALRTDFKQKQLAPCCICLHLLTCEKCCIHAPFYYLYSCCSFGLGRKKHKS